MQQESTTIRRWRARAGTVLAVLLVGAGLQAPAHAKKDTRNKSGEASVQEQPAAARPSAAKTIDRIIVEAESRHKPARVRKWHETTIKGRPVYVLRMEKDGKIWEIKVDAESGKEL
jgi:uncharacterized membrane protein YkoI